MAAFLLPTFTRRPTGIGSRLRQGLDWWLGELSALLPRKLRRWSALTPDRLVIRLHDDRIDASIESDHENRSLGQFDLTDNSAIPAELRSFIQQEMAERTRVIVRMPHDKVLHCTVKLPAAAKEDLHQVLSYEMDRYTPFTAAQACFDYRVTFDDHEQIEVMLYVTPRALVEQALRLVRRLGLRLHAVDIDDTQGEVRHSDPLSNLNLLPVSLRPQRYSRRQLLNRGLTGLILLLIASHLATPFWRQAQRLTALEEAVDHSHAAAKAAITLRDRRDALLASLQHLHLIDQQVPPTLVILRELTERIPDDTWLQRLEIQEGSLQIQGESTHASALIRLIEDSPLLENTAFRSPVTQDPRSGKSNFHISATLTKGPTQ